VLLNSNDELRWATEEKDLTFHEAMRGRRRESMWRVIERGRGEGLAVDAGANQRKIPRGAGDSAGGASRSFIRGWNEPQAPLRIDRAAPWTKTKMLPLKRFEAASFPTLCRVL